LSTPTPFDDAGEIEVTAREDEEGLRRHVVIDVLDQGRWRPTGTPNAGANGMAIMRGLMHLVNVLVGPDGTRVSLISCAVPQPTTSSRSRSKRVPTVDRDRVALALDAAAAQCRRAQALVDSVQAGRLRRRAQTASRAARRRSAVVPVARVWRDRVVRPR
jgi:hypothetical protein